MHSFDQRDSRARAQPADRHAVTQSSATTVVATNTAALGDILNANRNVQTQVQLGRILNSRPAVVAQMRLSESVSRRTMRRAMTPGETGPAHTAQLQEQGALRRTDQTETLQGRFTPVQRGDNVTGLPDQLKAGVEHLSGLPLDPVRVHYNSAKPATLQAAAFAQGSDIHVGPGQERHLPHEAWHVVQQQQGRVRPTIQARGIAINDDGTLEREADKMGSEALRAPSRNVAQTEPAEVRSSGRPLERLSAAHPKATRAQLSMPSEECHLPHQTFHAAQQATLRPSGACVQRVIEITDGNLKGTYSKPTGGNTNEMIAAIEKGIGGNLALGWKKRVRDRVKDPVKVSSSEATFLHEIEDAYPAKTTTKKVRPNFPNSAYWMGTVTREIQTGTDQSNLKPADENLALPHRFPYKAIENSTASFLSGKENAADLDRWTDRLLDATQKRKSLNGPQIKSSAKRKKYEDTVEAQITAMESARKKLKTEIASGKQLDLTSSETQEFLRLTNALHGNVPDYGPHAGVNIQVSDRTHLNVEEDGTLTPGSYAAATMSPHRGKGVALTSDGQYVVTTGGYKFDVEELDDKLKALLKSRGTDATTVDKDDLMEY